MTLSMTLPITPALPLMLASIGIGAALLLAASLLHATERAAKRPVRWIWGVAMLMTVGMTAALPFRTSTPAPQPTLSLVTTTTASVPAAAPADFAHRLLHDASNAVYGAREAVGNAVTGTLSAASNLPPALQRAASVFWLVMTGAVALMLYVVHRRVRTSAASWEVRTVRDVRVRVADDAGPAVIGVRDMQIVMPRWIFARTDGEQQLVLAHEMEHMKARDPLLLLSACAAVALMPWNPLLWYALSRLRLAIEIDCDHRVLAGGAPALRYGRLLLELSQHPSMLGNALPALSYSTSHLERRLLAMTARTTGFVNARRTFGAAAAALVLLAACEGKLPTAADVDGMDAKRATEQFAQITGTDTAQVTFIVNGKRVSKAEAEGIATGRIMTIDITKDGSRRSRVSMRTRPDGNVDTEGGAMLRDSARVFVLRHDAGAGNGSPDSVRVMVRLRDRAAGDGPDMIAIRRKGTLRDSTAEPMVIIDGKLEGSPGALLYVVDGRPLAPGERMQRIDPNTIERIEVLKGPAASVRYSDPRAANGVIVITTKK